MEDNLFNHILFTIEIHVGLIFAQLNLVANIEFWCDLTLSKTQLGSLKKGMKQMKTREG